MTIEAGALSLRISEIGAEQVERKLTNIDNKARALGSKTVEIRMTAPGIERLDNQLTQLGKQAQLFSTGAKFASTRAQSLQELGAVERDLRGIIANGMTPLEQRIKAEQTLASLAQKQPTLLGSLQTALGRTFAAYMTWNAVTGLYDALSSASDRAEVAQMKLSAAARLTGTSLSTVTAIAEQAQGKFFIGTAAASELAGGFVRLSSRAGDVAKTGGLMTAWMDLAAANGLTLDQGMQALSTTLAGQDEGLNRLGLANPSQIWKKWADAVGAHNGQLSEQQKWLAIVNEVMAQGETVRGSYSQFLETTPGKQQQLNVELERTAAAFGQSIAPARIWAYEVGTAILTVIRRLHEMKDTPAFLALMTMFSGNIGAGTAMLMAPDAGTGFKPQGPTLQQLRSGRTPPINVTASKPLTAAEQRAAAAERDRQHRLGQAMGVSRAGLGDVQDIIGRDLQSVGIGPDGKMHIPVDLKLEAKKVEITNLDRLTDAVQEQFDNLLPNVGQSFFVALGQSIGKGVGSGKEFILSALGSIFTSMGTALISYGIAMTGLLPALTNPFTSGPAAIAAGVILVALGSKLGALATGDKGSSGGRVNAPAQKAERNEFEVVFDPDRKLKGRSSSAVMPSSRSLNTAPMPEARPVVQIGTLNALHPDDPRWQRSIAETYMNAQGRGLIRKTG